MNGLADAESLYLSSEMVVSGPATETSTVGNILRNWHNSQQDGGLDEVEAFARPSLGRHRLIEEPRRLSLS